MPATLICRQSTCSSSPRATRITPGKSLYSAIDMIIIFIHSQHPEPGEYEVSLSLLGGEVSENFSGRGSTPYEAIRVAYKMVIKEENYVDICKNSMGENSIH